MSVSELTGLFPSLLSPFFYLSSSFSLFPLFPSFPSHLFSCNFSCLSFSTISFSLQRLGSWRTTQHWPPLRSLLLHWRQLGSLPGTSPWPCAIFPAHHPTSRSSHTRELGVSPYTFILLHRSLLLSNSFSVLFSASCVFCHLFFPSFLFPSSNFSCSSSLMLLPLSSLVKQNSLMSSHKSMWEKESANVSIW